MSLDAYQYRLTDDIAGRRLLYRSPLIGTPHVLLLDLPEASRGGALLLSRYYPVLLETDAELAEIEQFLTIPREGPVAPALFDRRPSATAGAGMLIAQYAPSEAGWPWVLVCRWPHKLDRPSELPPLARDCYTTDAFADAADMATHCATLVSTLGRDRSLELRMISPDRLSVPGTA